MPIHWFTEKYNVIKLWLDSKSVVSTKWLMISFVFQLFLQTLKLFEMIDFPLYGNEDSCISFAPQHQYGFTKLVDSRDMPQARLHSSYRKPHNPKFSCKTSSNLGSNIKKTITKQKQGNEVYNMTDISASRGKIGIIDNLVVEQL